MEQEVHPAKYQRAKEDEELGAIKKVNFILERLPLSAAERVLLYVSSKHADRKALDRRQRLAEVGGPSLPTPAEREAITASF